MESVTSLPAWAALNAHADTLREQHMRDLFAADEQRFTKFSRQFDDILLDFSKNLITEQTLEHLVQLAQEAHLPAWIERMFAGENINHTEQRAALHTALRNTGNREFAAAGESVNQAVVEVQEQLRRFAEKVRSGAWRGYTDKRIHDIVNIGIGGSDLGPRLVCQALSPYGDTKLNMHFISSVDSAHIHPILTACKPESTLFIIASKTFTTQETMTNAATAKQWLLAELQDQAAVAKHFVAVSTNTKAVQSFGIDTANMFSFWDWVGGRYSLWSAIGLPILISLGVDRFNELLAGAHAMDEHFRTAELTQNLPVLLALIGIWNNNFLGAQSHAILVYDNYLRSLPTYLQQLEMESNGKSVDKSGNPLACNTCPVIWGGPGNNGQHAFYQLLHQGTQTVSADFLAPVQSHDPIASHHNILLANMLAQAEALMCGKTATQAKAELKSQKLSAQQIEQLLPYKVFTGNRPSNTLLYKKLTPYTLGALLALYEHKVFVQGVIWNINSFDQWGVELGKQLANVLLPALSSKRKVSGHDSSTLGLLNYCKENVAT